MKSFRIPLLISAVLTVWGAALAYGAYRLNHNPWRAVMVMGCVAAFLAFWWGLLGIRALRTKQPTDREPSLPPIQAANEPAASNRR
jgi:hypothetical protein